MMDQKWFQFNWKQTLTGTAVGIIVLLALTGGAAGLISAEVISIELLNYAAAAVLVVSGFAGGVVAAGRGAVMNGILTVLLIWVFLFAVNAVMFDCSISGAWAALAAVMGGAGCSILLGMAHVHKRGSRRRKSRRR